MQDVLTGPISKMKAHAAASGPLDYTLPVGDAGWAINPHLASRIRLRHTGRIFCVHCGRKTNKSFSQGYCYHCFTRLAQCDSCIVKPELCHFAKGTCREPAWAQEFCFRTHVVYLANSSGLKVGITRDTQIPTRWIDQGASQALPLFEVRNRRAAGLVEVALATRIPDKTNWRALLKGPADILDMHAEKTQVLSWFADVLESLSLSAEDGDPQPCHEAREVRFEYPVVQYPVKVQSQDLDKTPLIEGVLWGIKGQYLMLDTGVINMRKYSGYELEVSSVDR